MTFADAKIDDVVRSLAFGGGPNAPTFKIVGPVREIRKRGGKFASIRPAIKLSGSGAAVVGSMVSLHSKGKCELC